MMAEKRLCDISADEPAQSILLKKECVTASDPQEAFNPWPMQLNLTNINDWIQADISQWAQVSVAYAINIPACRALVQ